MNPNGRVLLLTLSERTSAKGTAYMSGWLGKASVVAFRAEEPDKFGNRQWEVFVTEPQPRSAETTPQIARRSGEPRVEAPQIAEFQRSPARHQPREGWKGSQYRRPARPALAADDGELPDDPLDDPGRR